MSARKLFIIAYDITDNKRITKVRNFLRGYSTGGQKSVYECFLSDAELSVVIEKLKWMIQKEQDRIHVFQVDRRAPVTCLGIAVKPKDPSFFYFD